MVFDSQQPKKRELTYCPVAVTPQVTTKLAVEPDGNAVIDTPGLTNVPMGGLAAQVAPPAPVQVTVVQFSPVTTGSVTRLPGAAAGPRLTMVSV